MVSAIITTHNRCDVLQQAIRSVKEQTYKNIEIIVVDDASEDDTESICRKIDGISYIRIDKSETKGGNYARNLGIKSASGEYIAFLDDDDEWDPEKIACQVSVLDNNKDIGMVYTALYIETGKEKWNYVTLFDGSAVGDIVEKKLFAKPVWTTSTIMIRKDILDKIGGFDEKVRYWQEYEISLRIIQNCKVALINYPFVHYRKEIKDKKRLTNNYDMWKESVYYIWGKHEKLFEHLDNNGKRDKKEYFLSEGAYRSAAVGNKKLMRTYYKEAYRLTHKLEYFIRALLGISRQDTIYIEIILRKIIYLMNKNKLRKEVIV